MEIFCIVVNIRPFPSVDKYCYEQYVTSKTLESPKPLA